MYSINFLIFFIYFLSKSFFLIAFNSTILFIILIDLFNTWHCLSVSKPSSSIIFVGTYTGNGSHDSKGIYAFSFNDTTSTLTPLGLSTITPNPSYILIHPNNKYLYAVNEQDNGKINAFQIDSIHRGHLTLINQRSSKGSGPCYLSMDRAGQYIFVANYNNGTIAVLPIDENDGSLKTFTGFDQQIGSSINSQPQQSSHAHCILLDKFEEKSFKCKFRF